MNTSLASIRPLMDGKYHLVSRNTDGQAVPYLSVVEGQVIATLETRTVWYFAYQQDRGSYRIWQDGTENVLDSTQNAYSPTLVLKHHGEDWQQWAARLQIDGTRPVNDPRRSMGFTLTPLNFPQNVLATEGYGDKMFVKVLPAIFNGEHIMPRQLWVAIPV
ncbi:uncharacterized protein Bfra_005330 [Botrytis fragariae]|uniref:Uncharacterized protein n=1 Tax=Botrytis fragariae TaxID=1964551 RepID=A0A8H6AU75_9HELO|nr:uncharacterized protein Bfra_005330 [Botrytis fragariae]KAF5873863.1 hypothetical protein Bfra_005330 [Botrytis fragariae]